MLTCRRNNPFNIRYSPYNHWLGQLSSNYSFNSFVEFDTMEHGLRAGIILLRNYLRRGFITPFQIITRFAPPCENDTSAYLKFIQHSLPLHKPIEYNSYSFRYLCCLIARFETGLNVSTPYIQKLINKFNLS